MAKIIGFDHKIGFGAKTNEELQFDAIFRKAAKTAGKKLNLDDWHVLMTKRQAAKYRNKTGIVYANA